MAHMIDMTNNRANIAYIGERPWHGLGVPMLPDQPMEAWRVNGGLNYSALAVRAFYDFNGEQHECDGYTLIRSDNGKVLCPNVSRRYKVVQPATVCEGMRDFCDNHGFVMETMGALSDGKRIWALAKTGDGFTIGRNDRIENYVLLTTSYDKSMATKAMFTSIRVVCHNTLTMAVADKGSIVTIPHSADFDIGKVKVDLGIVSSASETMQEAFTAMAGRKVKDADALRWIARVLFDIQDDKELQEQSTKATNIIQGVFGLYAGKGKGSGFETAHGTAFGLLNAITEHVDHHAARNVNNRIQSAWFGAGDKLKAKAYTEALALVA